jgi:hypothetical protein
VLLALTLGLAGSRVAADDPPEKPPPSFAEVAALYAAAVAAANVPDQVRHLVDLCETAAKAAPDPKDAAAVLAADENRKTARALCKKALAAKDRDLLVAALKGYGKLALSGSSGDLRSFADQRLSERRPHAVRMAAVAAWAAIHDAGTHAVLIEHMRLPSREEEKQELAVAAARGLGQYRGLAKGAARYEMLKDTMQLFDALYNSQIMMASADAAQWWGLLHPALVESFNALTRATVKDHAGAVAWWRENRRKVQAGTD